MILGAGMCGAASFWGVIFSIKSRGGIGKIAEDWHVLLARMLAPMELGVLMVVIGWYFSLFASRRLSFAGHGIASLDIDVALLVIEFQFLPVLALIFVTLIGFGIIRTPSKNTWWEFEWMYVFNFITVLALFLVPIFILDIGTGFSISILNMVLAFAFGTFGVASFQFCVNRKSEYAEITYRNYRKMGKFLFLMLGIFILIQVLSLNGSLFITVPFIFQEIVLVSVIILSAWMSGPVLDGLLHVRKKYKFFEIKNPEDQISTILTGTALIISFIFLISSHIFDLNDYTLDRLVIFFLFVQSLVLLIISFIGYKILSK